MYPHYMQKLILAILLFWSLNSYSQDNNKIDSIYYLLDTSKTPVMDRLWDVDLEYGGIKVYTIRCSCLQYDQRPTFSYHSNRAKSNILSKKGLGAIKLTRLNELVIKAKQFTTPGFKGKYAFFLVEPYERRYIYHQVNLFTPQAPSIDYIVIPPDSTKRKN